MLDPKEAGLEATKSYSWHLDGYTDCSKSCGGGEILLFIVYILLHGSIFPFYP